MIQSLLAFVIGGAIFGSYAALSAYLGGWPFDVSAFGFAIYGIEYGLILFCVCVVGRSISHHRER